MEQLIPFQSGSLSAGWMACTVPHNRLLLGLSVEDFSLLQPQLEPVPLPMGARLAEPNTPIQHVYFLEQGIASVVASTPQGSST